MLKIHDRNKITGDTPVGAWARRWLHLRGHRVPISPCISTEADMSLLTAVRKLSMSMHCPLDLIMAQAYPSGSIPLFIHASLTFPSTLPELPS